MNTEFVSYGFEVLKRWNAFVVVTYCSLNAFVVVTYRSVTGPCIEGMPLQKMNALVVMNIVLPLHKMIHIECMLRNVS